MTRTEFGAPVRPVADPPDPFPKDMTMSHPSPRIVLVGLAVAAILLPAGCQSRPTGLTGQPTTTGAKATSVELKGGVKKPVD